MLLHNYTTRISFITSIVRPGDAISETLLADEVAFDMLSCPQRRNLDVQSDEALQLFYAQPDVFFLQSHYEFFEIIFVEAKRFYLLVLTLDIGEARYNDDNGVTGLLAADEDFSQMADFLSKFVTDPAWRAQMGAAVRGRSQRQFESQTVIDATPEVWNFADVAK